MSEKFHPPLWGNFVYFADQDLLAFAILFRAGLIAPSMYHLTQSTEKYFKALALSIIDPNGVRATAKTESWLKKKSGHNLCDLARKCGEKHSFYMKDSIQTHLKRFSEFDQLARYPWVVQKHGNGFTSSDVPIFEEIIYHLRTDIPITKDDYPLGLLIRGHFYGKPESKFVSFIQNQSIALDALNSIFRNPARLIKG